MCMRSCLCMFVYGHKIKHTHTHGEYGSCNLFDAFRDRERERTYRVNTKQENNIWVIKRVITTFGVLMRWVCGGCEREIL